MMDYCSCFASNTITFLATIILGGITVGMLINLYKDVIFEKAKIALISGLRDVTYGVSDIILPMLSPIISSEPVTLQANVTINTNEGRALISKHWFRYDPLLAKKCVDKRVVIYGAVRGTNSTEIIDYTPGMELTVYAHEIDSKYSHFVVHVGSEVTTYEEEEKINLKSMLR